MYAGMGAYPCKKPCKMACTIPHSQRAMIGEKSNIKTLNFTGKTENPNTEIHSFVMAIKPKFFVKIDTKDNMINKWSKL